MANSERASKFYAILRNRAIALMEETNRDIGDSTLKLRFDQALLRVASEGEGTRLWAQYRRETGLPGANDDEGTGDRELQGQPSPTCASLKARAIDYMEKTNRGVADPARRLRFDQAFLKVASEGEGARLYAKFREEAGYPIRGKREE